MAVALERPGALAVMLAEPAATPVTGTGALVAPTAKFTLAGTVATPALLELRLMVRLACAGADKINVRFCVADATIVRLAG